MLALLFAIALIAVSLLALMVWGILIGVAAGILALNVFVVILGLRVARNRRPPAPAERWQPKAFPPPQSPQESEEPTLTIHRM
jgi:hypothetical protein